MHNIGSIRTSPTSAQEVILRLVPLFTVIKRIVMETLTGMDRTELKKEIKVEPNNRNILYKTASLSADLF